MFPAGFFAPFYFDEAYFSAVGATPVIGSGGTMLLLGVE